MNLKDLFHFFQLELKLEIRNKFSVAGILLFCISSIYVLNIAVHGLEGTKFIALYWMITLFAASTATAKSFQNEFRGRNFYYYQLTGAENILFGKIIYNILLLLSTSLISYVFFGFFFGIPENMNSGLFLTIIILGALSLSNSLTLISAISIKSGGGPAMMAILGFPILIPQLMIILKVSKTALDGFGFDLAAKNLYGLLALNIIVGATAYILFPYLWRD